HVVDVRVLSRGTAEPLYVAIRLAYIKNTRDMMELPVIMDDPFVNFDEKRRENMYRLLQELSTDLQIIYFTFDDTAFGYFREHKMDEVVELFLLIKGTAERKTKTGNPFLTMTLQDTSGEMTGNRWGVTDEELQQFTPGSVVHVKGKREEYNGQPQLRIDKIRL